MHKLVIILFAVLIIIGACKKSNDAQPGTPDSTAKEKPADTSKVQSKITTTIFYGRTYKEDVVMFPYSRIDTNFADTFIVVTDDNDSTITFTGKVVKANSKYKIQSVQTYNRADRYRHETYFFRNDTLNATEGFSFPGGGYNWTFKGKK